MSSVFGGTKGPVKVVIDGTCSAAWPHIVPADVDPDLVFEDAIAELPSTHVERSTRGIPATYGENPKKFKPNPDHDKIMADANLIAESFNVLHETGLTPRQLAEQRAELLEALQLVNAKDFELHEVPAGFGGRTVQQVADDAIANATQQRNATGGEG